MCVPERLQPLLAEVRDLAAVDFASAGAEGRAVWLAGLRQLVDVTEVAFTHALASFDASGDAEPLAGAQSSAAAAAGPGGRLRPGPSRPAACPARRDSRGGPGRRRGVGPGDGGGQGGPTAARRRPAGGSGRWSTPTARWPSRSGSSTGGPHAVACAGRHDPHGRPPRRRCSRRAASRARPLLVPAGPDDDRTAAQRRADDLVDLAALALRSEQLPVLAGTVAAVDVVIAVGELTEGRGTTIHRGGFLPGCTRPPRHTDAHHLTSWLDGGPIDLATGLLLCRHHHRMVHEGGWAVHPRDALAGANGTLWFHGPRGQRLLGRPARSLSAETVSTRIPRDAAGVGT